MWSNCYYSGHMTLQVNTTSGEKGSVPGVSGQLRRARAGWLRVLLLLTGLALVLWMLRGFLYLVGYRHPVVMQLKGENLELRGQRRLMGLALGETHTVVPLSAVRQVGTVGQSATWAVVAAVAALLLTAAMGAVLVLWGVAGSQPSWSVGGLLIISVGVLLDAGAYLLVRRARGRNLATVELLAEGIRSRVSDVAADDAGALLRRLSERLS